MPVTKLAKQAQHIWCDITDDDGRIRGSAEKQLERHIKRIWKNGFKAGLRTRPKGSRGAWMVANDP